MEEIFSNKQVLSRLRALSGELRRWVIESLVELLKQESEDLIDAMEESRMELRDFLADFYNDGEEDRSRSRAYEQEHIRNEAKSRASSSISRKTLRPVSNLSMIRDDRSNSTLSSRSYEKVRSQSSMSTVSSNSEGSPFTTNASATLRVPSRAVMEQEAKQIINNSNKKDLVRQQEMERQMAKLQKTKEEILAQKNKSNELKALEIMGAAVRMHKENEMRNEARKKAEAERLLRRKDEIMRKKEESVRPQTKQGSFDDSIEIEQIQ